MIRTYESFLDVFKSEKRLERERQEKTQSIIKNKLDKNIMKIENFADKFNLILNKIFSLKDNYTVDFQNRTRPGDKLNWMVYIRKDRFYNFRYITIFQCLENEKDKNGIIIDVNPLYDKNNETGFDNEFISLFLYILEKNPDLDYNFFKTSPHYTNPYGSEDDERSRWLFVPIERLDFLDNFSVEDFKDWINFNEEITKYNL